MDRAPPTRLILDADNERATAGLWFAAALVSAVAGSWLLVASQGVPRLLGVSGLPFAWIFLRRGRLGLQLARRAPEHFVELTPDALTLGADGRSQAVAWSDVGGVRIDEDRLVVEIVGRDGECALVIEPRYGGLGLHALGALIEARRARQAELTPPAAAPKPGQDPG